MLKPWQSCVVQCLSPDQFSALRGRLQASVRSGELVEETTIDHIGGEHTIYRDRLDWYGFELTHDQCVLWFKE